MEVGAFAGLRVDPDRPVIPLYNAVAQRKSKAGSRVLVICVQPFEQAEDALQLG
jgi:hypothetical protein